LLGFKYICYFFWLLPNGGLHDIHLSNTLIHYKSDESAIQLTVKIFADDLEMAIKSQYGKEIKLFSGTELHETDSLLHLYINVAGNSLGNVFVGKELSEDLSSVWCYLEYTNVKDLQSFTNKNSILTEFFDDQRNMVMVKKDNVRKAHYTFNKGDAQKVFEL
jgi:hypothetical protein